MCRRYLHFLVDAARAHIESAAENAREREHVVDLVRVIAPARRYDRRTRRLRLFREDLRRRVRAGKDDRVAVHRLHHLAREHFGGRDADEHVRAGENVRERAAQVLRVRHVRHLFLDPVETFAAFIDRALAVAERHVREASREQQLRDRRRRRARAVHDDAHVLFLLPYHLQRVRKACERDDRSAVLVVVEDGDVAFFLELALDLKAAGRGDILEIDAAERAGDVVHRLHELVHILRLHAQRERVHIAERLEKDALALHDRHTGLGPDVAETEHRAAVRDDGAEIPPARQLIAFLNILLDLQTWLRHAGRVRERKIVLRSDRHGRLHFDLALPLSVQTQRFLCVVHNDLL